MFLLWSPNRNYKSCSRSPGLRKNTRMIIEECLRELTGKAALLRYMALAASINPDPPDGAVLAGLSDVCEEIEVLAGAVKDALDADALCIEVKRRR